MVTLTEPTTPTPPTRYFRMQVAALVGGLGGLLLTHHLTGRLADSGSGTTFATVMTMLLTVASLGAVVRSVYVIVTLGISDAHRVFRTRHLFACGVLLSVVAVSAAAALVVRGPFDSLFTHGRLTGEHVVDMATVVAIVVCLVGAGAASIGAWDAWHEERNWHRTLAMRSRRRI
jgi:hypothetical protein